MESLFFGSYLSEFLWEVIRSHNRSHRWLAWACFFLSCWITVPCGWRWLAHVWWQAFARIATSAPIVGATASALSAEATVPGTAIVLTWWTKTSSEIWTHLGDTRDTGDRVRKWVRSVSVKSLKKWHYHWLTDWLTRPSYRDASASQICRLSIVFFWTCCAKQISENRWGRDGKNKDGDEEGWGDHSEISRLPFNDFWCCCLNADPLGISGQRPI